MKIYTSIAGISLVSSLLSGCVTLSQNNLVETVPAQHRETSEIEWEVINRFRVVKGEAEEERFFRDVANYLEEVWIWSDKEKHVGPFPNFLFTDLVHHGDQTGEEFERDYETHYDKKNIAITILTIPRKKNLNRK